MCRQPAAAADLCDECRQRLIRAHRAPDVAEEAEPRPEGREGMRAGRRR